MIWEKYPFDFLKIEKPGRYVGGEFGSIPRFTKRNFKVAICFPDLYEIGMSNQTIKVLYNEWNQSPDIVCERVFTPFYDFEKLLQEKNEPLATLESGIPLNETDVLAITISYELSLTNILSVLKNGKIPINVNDRTEHDPIVIGGGPGITNPLPFSPFFDAVFIGEAEEYVSEILERMSVIKNSGGTRKKMMEILNKDPHFWMPGKTVQRRIWFGFSEKSIHWEYLPIPFIHVVQDHGVVEIMRGCPNKCRFCHASYFYRPTREKNFDAILDEVQQLVNKFGYKEITLTSLSSGDFSLLSELLDTLNGLYSSMKISFAVPSLRVSSFTLPLLDSLSKVRKGSLTFAVETACSDGQKSLNKVVDSEQIIEILQEAKKMGWKSAKFYFMFGLPDGQEHEVEDTVNFLNNIQYQTRMQLNVNVGIFIPKVHTPYQNDRQLNDEEGFLLIKEFKSSINNKRIKIGYHSSKLSELEGIVARGDERVGHLFLEAFEKGARFDSWSDYFENEVWNSIKSKNKEYYNSVLSGEILQSMAGEIENIGLGATTDYITQEKKRSEQGNLVPACDVDCADYCGLCKGNQKVQRSKRSDKSYSPIPVDNPDRSEQKIYFVFEKTGAAVYLGHLDIVRIVQRTLLAAGVDLIFSQGFNPKPVMEFANPLSLGISSYNEIFSVLVNINVSNANTINVTFLNSLLPDGLRICSVHDQILNLPNAKLMKNHLGSIYSLSFKSAEQLEDWRYRFESKLKELEAESYYIFFDCAGNSLNLWVEEFRNTHKLFKILKLMSGIYPLAQEELIVQRKRIIGKDKNNNAIDYLTGELIRDLYS